MVIGQTEVLGYVEIYALEEGMILEVLDAATGTRGPESLHWVNHEHRID
jgi:hypothetical protein